MGGKTKKKQARKQAATRTKSNGGRNGVSGHMKKSSIGNGKRAAESGDSSSLLLTKKSGKKAGDKKVANTKRKRDDAVEDDDDPEKNGSMETTAEESDSLENRASSMFTSFDDSSDPHNSSKEVTEVIITSGNKDEKRKKRKLNNESSTPSNSTISVFRELVPTLLIQLDDTSFSRLLYPNPVCFLTTINPKEAGNSGDVNSGLNVMTLSWMTPVNNYGGFAFAIHKTRYSSSNLLTGKKFTLSVPTAESRDLVLSVGRVSGKVAKKFDGSIPNLKAGIFGVLGMPAEKVQLSATAKKNKNAFDVLFDEDNDEENDESVSVEQAVRIQSNSATGSPVDIGKQSEPTSSYVHHSFPAPIDGTVAHMQCTVLSYTDAADAGTYLVIANINKASVHEQYWSHKGKCFVATDALDDHVATEGAAEVSSSTAAFGHRHRKLPPILSFLGSQRFGHVMSE